MGVLRAFFIYLSGNKRAQAFVLHNGLARRASRRFVAGETLTQAVEAVRAINRRGLHASLNYLGEKTTNPDEADAATERYVEILQTIISARLDCNLSVKLSQLGIAIDEASAEERLRRVLEAAGEIFVRIDMEESELVDPTLRVWRRLWNAGFHNVGLVLQAYLSRTAADLEPLVGTGVRIRLVKGAYLEPATVAYPKKTDVDENYRRLALVLLRRGTYPAFATHDERIIEFIKDSARRLSIPPERFEFQMIYGVRRDLQVGLAREGYNVRVYVPFGEEWYPYFMRRLGERPANVFFILRNIIAERRPDEWEREDQEREVARRQ